MSVTETIWLQVFVLPQESVACQVRTITCGQVPFVIVLITMTVTLVFVHVVEALGGSNVQEEPHWMILLVEQVSVSTAGPLVLLVTRVKLCKPTRARGGVGGEAPGFPVVICRIADWPSKTPLFCCACS